MLLDHYLVKTSQETTHEDEDDLDRWKGGWYASGHDLYISSSISLHKSGWELKYFLSQ